MRRLYISYKQVKMTYSLLHAYALICGWYIIIVNCDYLYSKKKVNPSGVTVLNTSSFHLYTKGLTHKSLILNIQLLPFDENDCCACLIIFSEKIGFGHSITCSNYFLY